MALSKIKSNSITTDAITSDKIAAGVVVASDIEDASITNAKLVNETITAAKVADSTLTGAKLVTPLDLSSTVITAPKIANGGFIADANGNEQIKFTTTASAVNELTIANAATGNDPSISTTGSDTNIGLTIAPKGTGDVNVDADTLRVGDSNADATITTNGTGDLTLSTNAGSNSGTIKIFDAANGNIEITPNGTGVVKLDGLSYPTADGSANQALVTNGSGVLSFAAVGASAGQVIQVVGATDTTKRTTTSTSFVTGSNTLTGVITPSSASNKIIVAVMAAGAYTSEQYFLGSVYRTISGTTVNLANDTSDTGGGYGFVYDRKMNYIILIYDSPNTTSEITYQFRFRTNNASYTAEFNESFNTVGGSPTTRSLILCMEVKQ